MLRSALVLLVLTMQPAWSQTLTGAEWQVTDLPGVTLPDGVQLTIAFAAEGRVSGHSGCNRFSGSWSQDGETLTFGPMAATRMACDRPRMEVEQRMLGALAAVRSVALTPGGALELLGPEGLLLRATRP